MHDIFTQNLTLPDTGDVAMMCPVMYHLIQELFKREWPLRKAASTGVDINWRQP